MLIWHLQNRQVLFIAVSALGCIQTKSPQLYLEFERYGGQKDVVLSLSRFVRAQIKTDWSTIAVASEVLVNYKWTCQVLRWSKLTQSKSYQQLPVELQVGPVSLDQPSSNRLHLWRWTKATLTRSSWWGYPGPPGPKWMTPPGRGTDSSA